MMAATSLQDLCQFKGHPGQFWPTFLAFVGEQVGATSCTLYSRQKDGWTRLHKQPTEPLTTPAQQPANLLSFLDSCLEQATHHSADPGKPEMQLLGVKLEQNAKAPLVALFSVPVQSEPQLAHHLEQLKLFSVCPSIYQQFRTSSKAHSKLEFFAKLLELLQELNSCEHFLAAAMLLVNTTQNHWRCSRVSLGWLQKGYIKLQAISQMERFEAKMELVGKLEAAMEEAFDQDEEVFFPDSDGAVNHDHEIYARQQQSGYLLSLPLRLNGERIGVLSCERQEQVFTQEEQIGLRLLLDQVVSRLAELKKNDRPAVIKGKDSLLNKTTWLFGPERSLAKLSALVILLLLLISVLVKVPYRVEAPIILRSADVRQVSAPVDGFIEQVHVKLGQRVEKNQLLLTLDNRELHLEESAAVANQLRYLREAEKARARGSLIDMKIAQAQTAQAKAKLDLIRHRLKQLEIRASIVGMVVEGDLSELHGTPVKKGEPLFKLARHEQLFVELKIAERDIHEMAVGQKGELAFIGQPEQKFPILLEQIDPVALSDDTGSSFLANGKTAQKQADWWRPGMSGNAKIEVGKRSIFWVTSHRTIDFLRMLLWW